MVSARNCPQCTCCAILPLNICRSLHVKESRGGKQKQHTCLVETSSQGFPGQPAQPLLAAVPGLCARDSTRQQGMVELLARELCLQRCLLPAHVYSNRLCPHPAGGRTHRVHVLLNPRSRERERRSYTLGAVPWTDVSGICMHMLHGVTAAKALGGSCPCSCAWCDLNKG